MQANKEQFLLNSFQLVNSLYVYTLWLNNNGINVVVYFMRFTALHFEVNETTMIAQHKKRETRIGRKAQNKRADSG